VIAVTRRVSPRIDECIVTHVERVPIDATRAQLQHDDYERALQALGCTVVRAPDTPELPDGVFVEDAVLVCDELAIVTRPALPARQRETASLEDVIARYRTMVRITEPATLEGGDVMRIGRTIFVGRGERTSDAGITQLRDFLAPHGYTVTAVPITRCLHLKTAVCAIADDTLLINPSWVDAAVFRRYRLIAIDAAEPFAANALHVGDAVIHAAAHGRTRQRLEQQGMRVVPVDVSELAKAEAGVTCCSVLFEGEPG
jgi:dimethylargininase